MNPRLRVFSQLLTAGAIAFAAFRLDALVAAQEAPRKRSIGQWTLLQGPKGTVAYVHAEGTVRDPDLCLNVVLEHAVSEFAGDSEFRTEVRRKGLACAVVSCDPAARGKFRIAFILFSGMPERSGEPLQERLGLDLSSGTERRQSRLDWAAEEVDSLLFDPEGREPYGYLVLAKRGYDRADLDALFAPPRLETAGLKARLAIGKRAYDIDIGKYAFDLGGFADAANAVSATCP